MYPTSCANDRAPQRRAHRHRRELEQHRRNTVPGSSTGRRCGWRPFNRTPEYEDDRARDYESGSKETAMIPGVLRP
jgi:hypothetical protein